MRLGTLPETRKFIAWFESIRDGGIDQCGVDVAAFAGSFALRERGEDSDHGIDAGEDIGHRNADARRFAVSHAGQIHDAAHALRHQIVSGALGVGSVLPKARHRAVDQAGAFRCEAFVVEPEFGEPANFEVFDQHVRTRGQLAHDAPAFLAFEIHFDRALSAIGRVKIGGADMVSVGSLDERRPPAACIVARSRALDLDHVGAQVGQHLPSPGPGKDAGQFKDA